MKKNQNSLPIELHRASPQNALEIYHITSHAHNDGKIYEKYAINK